MSSDMIYKTVLLAAFIALAQSTYVLQPTVPPTDAHWSVYQQPNNLATHPKPSNLPVPSAFRTSVAFAKEPRAQNHWGAHKLNGYLSYTTLDSEHNVDINPYALSINAELDAAFATVASYGDQTIQPQVAVAAATTAQSTLNNSNVDQSPTGAVVPFDWHRYFTMDLQQLAQSQPQPEPEPQHRLQIVSTADEVYQAKRSREELNKSL